MIKHLWGESIGIYKLPNVDTYNTDLIKFAYYTQKIVEDTDLYKKMQESGIPQNIKDNVEPFVHRSHLIPGFPLKWIDDVMWAVKEYIREQGEREFNQHNFPYLVPYVTRSWTNITMPGENIATHDHLRFEAKFSVSYYPKFLPNQGDLYLENTDLKKHKREYPFQEGRYREMIPGEAGKLIIFPGHLKHHTEYNQSNEDRISASCDIKFLGIYSELPPANIVRELNSAFQKELTNNFNL